MMDRDLPPLPAPVWPILGREREIDLAVSLLSDRGVRLLTLTGPAGVGKTRLSWEVGERAGAAFDTTVYVSLVTLRDAAMLPRTIASAFALSDSTEPIAGLRSLFGQQRVLLVLDNLEQIPGAGLALSPLLEAIRGLTILATSRSRLSIAGEHVLPVEPLVAPGADQTDLDLLSGNPAVQLLMLSARAANASYRFPDDEWAIAAAIARRLDGLPLALQLAGPRIPLLGARTVLSRLDSAFPLLSDGPHDRPPRLQTMRGAIAWSYDLLTDEEQALFRRLSIFTGGFTFEMAEAMVRGWQPDDGYPYLLGLPVNPLWLIGKEGPILEAGGWSPAVLTPISIAPLAGLDSLVQRNILRAVRSETGNERFELLETIREFGLEQLARHGETEAAQHAHAVLLIGIADLCASVMWGTDWRPAVVWVEEELTNIRSALAWLGTQPPAANHIRLRLAEALWTFWQCRGYATEGCAHLETALASPGGTPAVRAAALNLLGALSWIRNDIERAASALDDALPLLQQSGFESGLGRNFLYRSLIAWRQQDFERVEKMVLIARKHFAVPGDVIGEAMCSLILGIVARTHGDLVKATGCFTSALRGFPADIAGGFIWGMGIAQYYLGEVARQQSDRVRAVSNLRAALEMLLDVGDPWTVGGCVGTLATYRIAGGELEEAARMLGAAHALCSSVGVFLPPTEMATHEAAANDVRTRIGPDAFVEHFAEGERWSMEEAAAHAMLVPMESAVDQAARRLLLGYTPSTSPISARYLRTLRLMSEGRNVKEIAHDEGISPSSVYERFDRIKEQLGLDPHASHAEVMIFAVRNGIV